MALNKHERFGMHTSMNFIKCGFRRCEPNHNVYVLRKSKKVIIFLALYVDDLLIINKELWVVNKVKNLLSHEFEMKDLGEMEY